MKRLIRSIAAAALATAAFAATPALAHDRDHGREEPCHPGAPIGAYYPAPPPRPPARWHRGELRREYRELEMARERFYATWNGSPGHARRFERWYAFRKAELDRRWIALASW